MYVRLRLVVLALIALLAPSTISAQQTNAALAGPRIEAVVTGIRVPERANAASGSVQRRQSVGKPVALMVVGGAAIVLGALIGDDIGTIFMIGGAVALLIGLYQYLQ